MNKLDLNKVRFRQDPNYTDMESTRHQATMLMHIQNQNLHGKIFGGLIMKEAYELGWLCAHLHLNSAV